MEGEKIKIKIEGMHCSACEVLLERKFKKIEGVAEAKISHHNGIAEITCTSDPGIEAFQEAVKDTKYKVHPFDSVIDKKNNFDDYFQIGAYFVIIAGVYFLLRQLNLIPGIGISEKTSLAVIFLLGLIASVSSCMAITGGLLISIAARYSENHPNLSGYQKFKPQLYFNIGRIASYALLGGLIGAIGSLFPLYFGSQGILIIIASIIMIILGVQMLNVFPLLSRLHFRMPKFFAHKIHDAKTSHSSISMFFFGASTFFFPCGFTQALQFYVLTTGSFITGSTTMLAFSLGTFPALMSVGAIFSYVKGTLQKDIMRFTAILVILLGIFNMGNGLALSGVHLGSSPEYAQPQSSQESDLSGMNPYFAQYIKAQRAPPEIVDTVNGKQIAKMRVIDLNYVPAKFIVKQGVPVEWQIDASKAAGCSQVITAPKLRLTKYLSPNQINKIEFTPKETGKIYFMCTMAMTTNGASFEVVSA